MYENLAAKYRPGNLEEVMGQDTIKTTLANSVRLGRLAHAYVFYGPRGCGKTSIARILAKTLNCHAKDGRPCGKCPSCVEIAESKSLDVIEIDAASHTDVDNVRNVIIDNVGLSPSRDRYKVYILDEVHMLSKQSFNALLKTVEEPPAHVVFVMATTEQTKVPVTILSRSQCFRFRPIPEDLIAARLKEVAAGEKLKVSDEALAVIARSAGGAMRDALTLLDRAASFGKGSVELDVLNELLGHASPDLIKDVALALVNRDAQALHAGFEKISREGYDHITMLRDLRNALSETFLHVQGFSKFPSPLSAALRDNCTPIVLARLSRKLNAVIDEVKFSDSPALAAEMALFTLVETPQDLDGLVKRLEALEAGTTSGGAASFSPAAAPLADQQKKNERSGLTPVQTSAAPAIPGPASAASAAGLPSSTLWKRLLGIVSAKKPLLYNVLLSVRVSFPDPASDKNGWQLLSANKFEADIIEKARKDLEDNLEQLAGRKISLTVECGTAVPADTAPEPSDQAVESAEVLEADDAQDDCGPEPETRASSVSKAGAGKTAAHVKREEPGEPRAAADEPELKHLNKVFHGRITRIQKTK